MPPAPLATRLLVLRHGQSAWNAEGRWQGHADVPLDEEGQRQAHAASAEIVRLGRFGSVWASDLQRAVATAEQIAVALGVGAVLVDRRLRETDVGPWEGLNQQQVEHGWPGFLEEHRRPDGFESYDAAALRMLAAFADIAARDAGSGVVVVSHGGIIRATRRALGAIDQHLPNLGGYWFDVDALGAVTAGDVVVLRDRCTPASEVL